MSRRESDREDLLREATALVERAEVEVEGLAEPVVVGFRKDGAASVFFGADPVYQFNSAGELRRAFVDGLLYKAEQGKLVSLQRERTESETALVRGALSESETAAFVSSMQDWLTRLRAAMAAGKFTVTGEWPVGGKVSQRIHTWLMGIPTVIVVAKVANVR
jgi:hypothetical protein